jgi:Holliday junction resolvase RusA-like endonuclease
MQTRNIQEDIRTGDRMKIVIRGIPLAVQGFKFTRSGMRYQPAKVKEFKGRVGVEILDQLPKDFVPFSGPLVISNLTFVFPAPKSLRKAQLKAIEGGIRIYKPTKPDLLDNLSKGLFDACKGILFMDDSQIVAHRGELAKIYGNVPRIEFEIEEVQ